MKRVLNDLTPLPGNDLFITQYWFDKQTDPPLHFHEDYMLSLTPVSYTHLTLPTILRV